MDPVTRAALAVLASVRALGGAARPTAGDRSGRAALLVAVGHGQEGDQAEDDDRQDQGHPSVAQAEAADALRLAEIPSANEAPNGRVTT